jgi:iron complex transport system ATP-binding protein
MSLLATEALAIGHRSADGAKRLAQDIALRLSGGEVTCLLGPNGVGKTTLFRTLLGLLPPLAGRIRIDGRDLASLSRSELARLMAYVPQAQPQPFAHSVRDLVLMGRTAHLGTFATPGAADRAAADAALARLGIADLAGATLTRISGGQAQLTLIARALAQQARLIVMDEPTASLDLGNRALVQRTIRDLAAAGFGVLVSTHEPELAFATADRVAVLARDGSLACGPTADLLTAERLSSLYATALAVETTPSGRRVVTHR